MAKPVLEYESGVYNFYLKSSIKKFIKSFLHMNILGQDHSVQNSGLCCYFL